jgi:DNA polymerase III delta' subunit
VSCKPVDHVKHIVSGQEVAVKILKAILKSGRVAHAYLLKGPAGSGKTALARQFAKGLLCLNPGPAGSGLEAGADTGLSCNMCESCSRVDKGSHPDLLIIEKEGTSIRISASHGMIMEVLTRPLISKRKVFIVDDAEALTAEAANALLKLLEEPPAYVNFILTTSNETAIPATVVSRCQVIPLRALPTGAKDDVDVEVPVDAILRASPVDLALEHSKADSQDRHRFLAALELRFAQRLFSAAMGYNRDESGEHMECELHGEHEMSGKGGDIALMENFRVLRAITRARRRLAANTNPFLVFCTLFMDIQKLITEEI